MTYERLFHVGRLKKWQKPRTFGVHRIHEAQCTVDLGRSRLACGSPPSTEANVSPQAPKQHDSFIPPYPPAIIPTSRKAPRRSKRPFLYDLRIVICLASRAPERQGIHSLHAPVSAMLEAGVWPCFPGRRNRLCCFVFVSCVFYRWNFCVGRGNWDRCRMQYRCCGQGKQCIVKPLLGRGQHLRLRSFLRQRV